ncbi:sugar ABC transporter ATP-binding protein [Streptomyces resistomycificus]|uniref:Sugar ABC transporter ATPase n=1 Tax=Streptomyces resistomycificus TaxID=67356 RepID=A0A0L8LW55_9ACTN|nr:sugar ABC transporter ATP-binding protein [Streptomyces resistomycificus]KOG42413.1 sugar ABC transporter ATPase [Streptomyces resistomycificus]KUN92562.1 sugar ABC transporter ATP-binding protein [Streptomyces resistomycificus]
MNDAPDDTTPSPSPPDGLADSRPLVTIRGLRKRFGGTLALADVDLDVHAGSVLALLGHNGAGKSTLIKILAGVYRADEGQVTVAGHPLGTDAASTEMSFIHQDLGLVEWMTVAENVALGTGYPRRGGLVSWRQVRRRCTEALDIVAGHLDPDAAVADLTRAERSLVAIARALSTQARLIVLDEPTASLPAADCARLFDVLHTLRDRGHAIVYVSHRLDEVYQVADRFAVLRDGHLISEGLLADHGPERIVHDIVGREPESHRPAAPRTTGTTGTTASTVLRLTGAATEGAGPVDLELCAGEVLGMVGLTGAGHMDLGRALAGARPFTGGEVLLDGLPYRPRSVAAAVDAGVGFVTSNRQEEGCALELTVRENFLTNPRADGRSPWRWNSPRRERLEAGLLVERFGVRPADPEAPIATLSGGNQQKVMIGRWLRLSRRVVILEEPTAGVDVGAKAEIYRLLDDALAQGLAVLLISTDFEEVADVCHRALVFVRGGVTAELSGEALTVTELTHAASAMPALIGTGNH